MSQRLGGVASDIESGAGASLLAVRAAGGTLFPTRCVRRTRPRGVSDRDPRAPTRCEHGRDGPPVSPNLRAPGNGRLRQHPRAAVTLRVRSRRCQGARGQTPSRARRRNEVPAGGAGAHHVPGGFARGRQEAPAASSGLPTPARVPRSPCTCRWSRTLPHEAAILGDPTAPGHSQALAGHGREGPGSRGESPPTSPCRPQGPSLSARANRSHRPL